MIKLENVCCGYGKKEIVHSADAVFEKNKITVIVGPNGCGKTTLLKTMAGVLKAKNGSILVDNISLEQYKRRDLAKKLSLLPQIRHIPNMTVETLIMCARYPYLGINKVLGERDRKAVNNAMEMADVVKYSDRTVRKLSGGERQKVYIAMMLAQETDIILLDEPTTYLDIEQQFEILNLIRDMKNQGKTIIMVLHDLSHCLKYADNVIVMDKGNIVAKGSKNEIIQSKILEKVYDIRLHTATVEGEEEYIMRK